MYAKAVMAILAIGDIHGCHFALSTLMNEVKPDEGDQLIFLGDYIDRGPSSRAVIELLIRYRSLTVCEFLKGNHELMIVEALDDKSKFDLWLSYGGLETLESYGGQPLGDWPKLIPESHWHFLKTTVKLFETDKYIFVHACLDPDADLEEQPDWLVYWEFFDRVQPHKSGKRIICGHTPDRNGKIKDLGFATCIDTGPAVGGWLTCLDCESGQFWQANERGEKRNGRLERWA
jgi:serine/threonine protein phosphatase 1